MEYFGEWFDNYIFTSYTHWESGAENIDFTLETKRIAAELAELGAKTDVGELVVFAKSAGSLLTFIATHAGVMVPAKCVFFGIPFDLASKGLFENDWSSVDTFTVPSLAFHNEYDPTAGYAFTKDTIAKRCPTIELVTTLLDNHSYVEFSDYDERISVFLTPKQP